MSSDAGGWDRARGVRVAIRLALLAGVLTLFYFGGDWIVTQVNSHILPAFGGNATLALLAVSGVYVLLMALPFVPGIEISLSLLMILGLEGIPVVYFSTLVALSLSFLVGRLIPCPLIARLLGWLHLHKAEELVCRLDPLAPEEKLAMLVELAPARIVPFLLRYRYLAVAVAFNVPGNAVIGGGGGIGLLAGLSGLFRFRWYLLMCALAISPIPLGMLVNAAFR